MNTSSGHNAYTDDELLQYYRSTQDNQWLGTLLQRYTTLLFGVAMKYLKDRDEASDAVQQVFLKTITHFPTAGISNFKGWLYILMRNHCFQLLRDKNYKAPDEVLERYPDSPGMEKQEHELHDQTLEQLVALVDELNAEQGTCIRLFYLEKKSYQQITDQTGYNFAQVKSYIQNGKRNLKLMLFKKMEQKRS